MVDGHQNKRIGFIIQARMQSSRLPGKILLPLPLGGTGKPLLQWILDELKQSVHHADIHIATSTNKENDVLETFCEKNNVFCFRGDEEDVLSRFIGIINEKGYKTVVRLTADNPILDIGILDEAISNHIRGKHDYTITKNLPLGMNFEVVSATALLALSKKNLTAADCEHVTLYIRNSKAYKKEVLCMKQIQGLSHLRLTVDYPSDLLLLSTILSFAPDNSKGMELVEKVFLNYPFIFQANQMNIQKKQFANKEDEFMYSLSLLENLELNHTVELLTSIISQK